MSKTLGRKRRWWAMPSLALALIVSACQSERFAEVSAVGEGPSELICYQEARAQTLLRRHQAERLCEGSAHVGPVRCFLSAHEKLLQTEALQIELCRHAHSAQPVECFVDTKKRSSLEDDEIRAVCATLPGATPVS